MNPKAREAFAAAEERWYAERTQRAVFAAGGSVSWVPSEEPAPLLDGGRMYVEPSPMAPLRDEAVVDERGAVSFQPSVPSAAALDMASEDTRAMKRLEKWLALPADERERFLSRAAHNVPEWDHKASLEYAAYCLFARGRQHPFSRPVYRALVARLKAAARVRKHRGSVTPK
jgi:hypothetical protein